MLDEAENTQSNGTVGQPNDSSVEGVVATQRFGSGRSPGRRLRANATRPSQRRKRRLHATTAIIVLVGLIATGGMAFAAWSVRNDNENRLLEQRARAAAAVLTAALPSIQTPLASAAVLAEATNGTDRKSFNRLMRPLTKSGQPFVSASVWEVRGGSFRRVLNVGSRPKLLSLPTRTSDAFFLASTHDDKLGVLSLLRGRNPRLGYSFTAASGARPRFVAYAETALPSNRKSLVQRDSAFSGLATAVYLGKRETPDTLLTATTSKLPLRGRRATQTVPFGNTALLVVMSPTTDLGGRLLALLPWLVGLVGLSATAGSAVLTERLLRRRDQAESLASENAQLMLQQRTVAETLQHSLLPDRVPGVSGMDVAVRYLPGTVGIDIGGDWYDLVRLVDGRLLVVVGDVSGRGLGAARVMASLRYGIQAFASQGDSPAVILRKLNPLMDADREGHFATVICAIVDIKTRQVTIANAGHPNPLLVGDQHADFVETTVGVPIGVLDQPTYNEVTVTTPRAATLLFFTDGLFERRGETIQVGLERLRQTVLTASNDLEDLLSSTLEIQSSGSSGDDMALVGLRWQS